MRHFLSLRDFTPEEVMGLVARARAIKGGEQVPSLRGKVMGLLFFKQSLRTRMSFEAGLARVGASCVSLTMNSDSWGIETRDNQVMDGVNAEHVKDAAPVLSRYVDFLGVRTQPKLEDLEAERADTDLRAFARYARVPVVNLESSVEHPCQALADIMTLEERLPTPRNKKFVFTWLPQARVTPLATAHSVAMVGGFLGMDVTIVHPPGYDLLPEFVDYARSLAERSGGSFDIVVTDSAARRDEIARNADVVYGKNWGSSNLYGRKEAQLADLQKYADWRVTTDSLGEESLFMHCLPVRRNLKVSDAVLDSPRSIVVDQAENRMWAQLAILEQAIGIKD